jgi:hypothetical protein
MKLATIEEMKNEGNRLVELGLAAFASVSISVRGDGEFHYWAHTADTYLSSNSPTLDGLESALRETIAKNDPAAILKAQADKLGFELVEKTLRESMPTGDAPPMPVAMKSDLCGEVQP